MSDAKSQQTTRLLTTQELAERLGLGPETIRRWAREGRIPALRPGRRTLRFDFGEVVAALRHSGQPVEASR